MPRTVFTTCWRWPGASEAGTLVLGEGLLQCTRGVGAHAPASLLAQGHVVVRVELHVVAFDHRCRLAAAMICLTLSRPSTGRFMAVASNTTSGANVSPNASAVFAANAVVQPCPVTLVS